MRFIISATGEGKNTIHCYSALNIKPNSPKQNLQAHTKTHVVTMILQKLTVVILLNKKVHF